MGVRFLAHIRGNVVGYIAIFLAMSGGVYAAAAGRNTVDSASIVNGQVKGIDVRDDGLTGADIDESTLRGVMGSGGAVVRDANGVLLGYPLSVTEEDLQVVTPKGFIARLDWDGGLSTHTFAVTAVYAGLDCSGARYFPTTAGSGAVIYGKFTHPLDRDRLIAPRVSPDSAAAEVPVQSYDSVALGCRNIGSTTQAAWPARVVSRARTGLPREIAPPLRIKSH